MTVEEPVTQTEKEVEHTPLMQTSGICPKCAYPRSATHPCLCDLS